MEIKTSGQIPFFDEDPQIERDRNFEQGGRSFYFFDFDDNVVHLPTKIVLFDRQTHEEFEVSTEEYAAIHTKLGEPGSPWERFELRDNPMGSYRNFREHPREMLEGREQPLVEDMLTALKNPFLEWRGPSWDFFYKAVKNNRSISIITARGHHPHTIRRAVNLLVQSRDLAVSPNYLSIYPVSHEPTRAYLGDSESKLSIAELKKIAIKVAVQDAFECYGQNEHHRFGMSDDDPKNIALIVEAMRELKAVYPKNEFFVFNTFARRIVREEVVLEIKTPAAGDESEQIPLV
ncbi:MAG TPA: hypothetical protein VM901_12575 [Bdellovibrionota bacterium]|jgi:hypothetical protein|nr:hypothetical protein [Bdellovibrionota bacterium]